MNSLKPIYTEKARCQDCYKCVRECPVKAIKVVNDTATVMHERCVYCGTCVNVCPVGAKKVREDLGRAKLLLKRKPQVLASLAPSFVAEFPDVAPGRLIHALRQLGFSGVSETALGAEQISQACAELLGEGKPGTYVSTACPTVVELIRKYHPDQVSALTPFLSPMLAHCRLLRQLHGEEVGIVFIGPCVSKKLEGDAHPELVDVVLSFSDLRQWLEERGIDPRVEPETEADVFVPGPAGVGALYPVDGGMARGIQFNRGTDQTRFMAFSGIQYLQDALQGLSGAKLDQQLFLEMLACEGGCVNGPQAHKSCGTALKWLRVLNLASKEPSPYSAGRIEVAEATAPDPVQEHLPSEIELQRALRRVGKTTAEDELNCGGCGYDTCRKLATALVDGRAEPNMCVSYMRKMAMNKANALIRSMPAGVVIVNDHLEIVECNRRFAEVIGGETLEVYDAKPGMEGASLEKVAFFHGLFATVLDTEQELLRKDMRHEGRVLRVTVFPIEPGLIVGGIVQDITEPAVEREQVIQKAQEVIRKNITTVQQIAFLLGENAAETEMILDSIIDSYRLIPALGAGRLDDGKEAP